MTRIADPSSNRPEYNHEVLHWIPSFNTSALVLAIPAGREGLHESRGLGNATIGKSPISVCHMASSYDKSVIKSSGDQAKKKTFVSFF